MDWIEIYNPTSNPINLAGYLNRGGLEGEGFFSDPSFDDEYLIVAPVGFMVVYCYCREDQTDLDLLSLTPLMTSFSIDADGDVLAL